MSAPVIERPDLDVEVDLSGFEQIAERCDVWDWHQVGVVAGYGVASIRQRCENEASWWERFTCHCGHQEVFLVCEHHHEQIVAGIGHFTCETCDCTDRTVARCEGRL